MGKVIEFHTGDFVVEKKNISCLAKARDFPTLPNLKMLCIDEGINDFDIRYVGGLWETFEFKTMEACKKFMAFNAIDHWITEK